MKTNKEISIKDFTTWSGGVDTQEAIIEAGKCDEFDSLIGELYPDGLSETTLNDLLWFEEDWIFEALDINQ